MLGLRGRLFVLYSDYQVAEYPDGTAIGAGQTLARGSLHTSACYQMSVERRLTHALEAACTYDIYCSPPFTYLTSPKSR